MHNYVLGTVPQKLLLDTDQKTIIVALFSLVVEHHGAILKRGIGCQFGAEIALEQPAPRLLKTA